VISGVFTLVEVQALEWRDEPGRTARIAMMATRATTGPMSTPAGGRLPVDRRRSTARDAWEDNTEPELWWDRTDLVL